MKFWALGFGSAAAVLASGGALAADLPSAEPADQYVRVCDAFGAGFFYIPGTDTCLRINGHVRAGSHYVDGDPDVLIGGGTNSEYNNWTTRTRATVGFDAQTSSAIGLIRSYIELQTQIGPNDYAPDASATNFDLPYAFVEVSNDFGTFTAGRTDSFFDFFGSNGYGTRIGVDDNTTEATLFAYTFNGASGLKATLSAENPDSAGRRLDSPTEDYEGLQLPDLVGNVRIEKEWGSAQIMGVVRQIHDVDGDGIGWAAGAGATVSLPVGGLSLSTEAGYADGALAYITLDPGGIGDFSGPKGSDTNQAWMVRASLSAPFGDKVSAWLDSSFTHAKDDVNDDSYNFWAFALGAAWAPNGSLSMGPEIAYNRLDGDDPGEDGSLWGVMWRIESSF